MNKFKALGFSFSNVRNTVFPFLPDIQNMTFSTLRADLMAGLSVAPVAVPQVMAYAVIAGIDPKYGLFAATFTVMVAALWGSSRFLAAGPTNAIAMMLFFTIANATVGGIKLSTLSPVDLMPYVFGITLMVGFLQLVMGLIRLGELANFISHSVMVGFSAGAAVLIAAGQIPNFFGFDIGQRTYFFQDLVAIYHNLHSLNPWTMGLGVLTIVTVIVCKRISYRIPAYLVSIIIVSFAAYTLDLKSKGVIFVGEIPAVFPPLSLPPSFSLDVIRDLFYPALAIAILGAVESLAIGKNLTSLRREPFDGNQELIGQGLGNITAGFTSGMPSCGSFTRSVLNFTSGGKTRFATVFSGLFTIPVILFCAPMAANIPMAALAGMLFLIAWGMIDRENIRLCYVATRIDRIVFVTTLIATLVLDLEKAIFIGVLLSLVLLIYKEAHPRMKPISKEDLHAASYEWCLECKHVSTYFVEGTLFFGAVQALEKQLQEQEQKETKVIVLNLARVFWIDASGAHALGHFAERCHASGVPLILVTNDESINRILRRSGVLDHIGEGFVLPNIDQGLSYAKELLHNMGYSSEEKKIKTFTIEKKEEMPHLELINWSTD